jgi:hypothetical protein
LRRERRHVAGCEEAPAAGRARGQEAVAEARETPEHPSPRQAEGPRPRSEGSLEVESTRAGSGE